jgi:hypothetical protein
MAFRQHVQPYDVPIRLAIPRDHPSCDNSLARPSVLKESGLALFDVPSAYSPRRHRCTLPPPALAMA